MNNKYDVSLCDSEKEQLASNIREIANYLKDLAKPFGTSTKLNTEWTFYDKVWGRKTCRLEIEKTFRYKGVWGDSEKEWYVKVRGQIGGLSFELSDDIDQTYALSLLDNWKDIKVDINNQVKQREETRQLLVGFEL